MNDDNADWLQPALSEIYRVMKNDTFCVSFYGWSEVDKFMTTWKSTGFKPVNHSVWHKRYALNSRYLRYKHEQVFLLTKGYPPALIEFWMMSITELTPVTIYIQTKNPPRS